MSASSVRSKFMEVEKEKKRQRRMAEDGIVPAPVKEEAPVVDPVRARNEDGTLQADDKSTPDVNEAWVGGIAPKKKSTAKKKKS